MPQPWQNCKRINFLIVQYQIICKVTKIKSTAEFLLFPRKNHVFKSVFWSKIFCTIEMQWWLRKKHIWHMKHMFFLERLLMEVVIYLLIKLCFFNCSISLVGVDYLGEREGECGVGYAKNNLRTNCAILMKPSLVNKIYLQIFTLEPSSEVKF